MSHSRIFQLGLKPIKKEDYASSEQFYDNSHDFADYIGDEVEGAERKEDIGRLADTLKDIFTLDAKNDALVYKGESAMSAFKAEWAAGIAKAASVINGRNVVESHHRHEVEKVCDCTHLNTGFRFKIEGWSDYAGTAAELVSYVASEMKHGAKLYVAAVIDYHC